MTKSYLLTGGPIWTGDPAQPWAQAVVVRGRDLTTGKAADLTVLGADLFRVAPHEIHAVPVVLTMMDGRITHDAR
ncbi:MAG TPA: hypothetical protein PK594_00745 [Mycobacterium sp.]|nr:hypothetical protein [Mycobacterium sp.]HNF04742.1 hypothetical protein [Mycobacterium sp.]